MKGAVLTLWKSLWSTPEASQWRDVDRVPLTRLVELAAAGSDDARVLAELRQLEDRFGLSPHARKVLGWELVEEKPAAVGPVSSPGGREGALRVIAGGSA